MNKTFLSDPVAWAKLTSIIVLFTFFLMFSLGIITKRDVSENNLENVFCFGFGRSEWDNKKSKDETQMIQKSLQSVFPFAHIL